MKVDVSLDLYRIFCAVVRTGNMSAAARELFISQPAVSMSIRQLEDRMGSPLLVRTAKGVYPTAEGKLLYTYLEQALGLIQAAEEKYYQMVHFTHQTASSNKKKAFLILRKPSLNAFKTVNLRFDLKKYCCNTYKMSIAAFLFVYKNKIAL